MIMYPITEITISMLALNNFIYKLSLDAHNVYNVYNVYAYNNDNYSKKLHYCDNDYSGIDQ